MSRKARVASSGPAPYHRRRDAEQLEVYRRDGSALKLGMQGALANTIIRPVRAPGSGVASSGPVPTAPSIDCTSIVTTALSPMR